VNPWLVVGIILIILVVSAVIGLAVVGYLYWKKHRDYSAIEEKYEGVKEDIEMAEFKNAKDKDDQQSGYSSRKKEQVIQPI